ncbi:MAG: helicase-related protein [Chthoniobacterales bacterium]
MKASDIHPGQRWASDTEPELGLGILMKAEFGRVEIYFPAAGEHRQYALESAPLRRIIFRPGDRIRTHRDEQLTVESVTTDAGIATYVVSDGAEVPEAELADTISFSAPEDRLLAGRIDDNATFDLRVATLGHRSRIRQSPVRGFAGARIDLIPHQLHIAAEVAGRLAPRVLLADEVGLGKTIEACLTLHRMHLTGRADRVLILVPDPLVHQWFVELLRRFNLLFSLFDEERCKAIQAGDPDVNPFLDSQLVLVSAPFLAGSSERAKQAVDAGWDLLIVDEAHHLEEGSEGYAVVADLAARIPAVLLLTATPQQLGLESHFARLRLLDPDRYGDFDQFVAESERYTEVAREVDDLIASDAAASEIADRLDRFGTGRVMFRNTRAALSGFPERKAHLVKLTEDRVTWLVGLLRELDPAKVLLICRTRELAEEVYESLLTKINVTAAVFHEGLTLLQRDRNAAFFAEPEGARILICSEIGSEGRNFQFAHHLVLYDLPDEPELLEQRIGRLDRIGQSETIHIHVPFDVGTESEILARWYHEGLGAFEHNLHGAAELARTLEAERRELLASPSADKLPAFLKRSKVLAGEVSQRMAEGHDRLLELNSSQPEKAATLIERIEHRDTDPDFEEYVLALFDHFGIHVEELGHRGFLLRPGHLLTDAFPALPDEGLSVTFDRRRALSREDLGFFSMDHPMVRGAIDLLLGAETGNAAFGVWRQPGPEAMYLEAHAIAECVAPASLHADRFLPPHPIRVAVDHRNKEETSNDKLAAAKLEKGDVFRLLHNETIKRKLVPAMLAETQRLAELELRRLVKEATARMNTALRAEIDRLEHLAKVNDQIRPEEITALGKQREELRTVLAGTRLRLDAVRLVHRQPPE